MSRTNVICMIAPIMVSTALHAQEPICHDGSRTWQSLCIRDEPTGKRRGYVRADHADSEAEIIRRLPTLSADGSTFKTPYSCKSFKVDAKGKASTDIEHIVALAEAHDSGLAPSLRHALANDLDNQTVADRTVNRNQKRDKDAGEWQPQFNGGWFAARTIEIKRRYGLSVDAAEVEWLKTLLGGSTDLSCP